MGFQRIALGLCAAVSVGARTNARPNDCDEPSIVDVCTAGGPDQRCFDRDPRKNNKKWGCVCEQYVATSLDGFEYGAPSPLCLVSLPPTPPPAPPTPAPTGPGPCAYILNCDPNGYKPSTTADPAACTCAKCIDASWMPDVNQTACIPATPEPPTPPPTPAPPKGFSPLCNEKTVYTSEFDLAYVLGMAGQSDDPAIQVSITIDEGKWAGVGLRAGSGDKMDGLDITVLETDGTHTVREYDTMQTAQGPPQLSADQMATWEVAVSRGRVTVRYWRLLKNGKDLNITDGMTLDVARAWGSGASSTGHATSPSATALDTKTIAFCPSLKRLVGQTTTPPEAWQCEFISNCELYKPFTEYSAPEECVCGLCDAGFRPVMAGTLCIPDAAPDPVGQPAPTAAPAPVQGDFGCHFILHCEVYGLPQGGTIPQHCYCSVCQDGTVPDQTHKHCHGTVAPFGCTLIPNCELYTPSTSADAAACPCGQCEVGFSPDTTGACVDNNAFQTQIPNTGSPSGAGYGTAVPNTPYPPAPPVPLPHTATPNTAQPSTGMPTTGQPTTGLPTVVDSTGRPTTGQPTTGVPNTALPGTFAPAEVVIPAAEESGGFMEENLIFIVIIAVLLLCVCLFVALYIRNKRSKEKARHAMKMLSQDREKEEAYQFELTQRDKESTRSLAESMVALGGIPAIQVVAESPKVPETPTTDAAGVSNTLMMSVGKPKAQRGRMTMAHGSRRAGRNADSDDDDDDDDSEGRLSGADESEDLESSSHARRSAGAASSPSLPSKKNKKKKKPAAKATKQAKRQRLFTVGGRGNLGGGNDDEEEI